MHVSRFWHQGHCRAAVRSDAGAALLCPQLAAVAPPQGMARPCSEDGSASPWVRQTPHGRGQWGETCEEWPRTDSKRRGGGGQEVIWVLEHRGTTLEWFPEAHRKDPCCSRRKVCKEGEAERSCYDHNPHSPSLCVIWGREVVESGVKE